MKLAPIAITVYGRINHLERTIEALKRNTLAKESDLYLFSDAPKGGDEEKVMLLRKYLYTIKGFKKVYIIERNFNGRVANGRGGIRQLLEQYGNIIYMEEDIVTAPGFLKFMNDALDYYKNSKDVLSVSGYTPPLSSLNSYHNDVYKLTRFNAWGFATWRDKFDPFGFDIDKHGVENYIKNSDFKEKFNQNGEDLYEMLMQEYNGNLDALDVKIMFYGFKYNKHTIYPRKSLVQNTGHDGSGTHCGVSNKFHHKELWGKVDKFKFIKDLKIDENIVKENYKFRRLDWYYKFIILSKKYKIFPLLRYLKRRVKG
jgi:hypothetical protein